MKYLSILFLFLSLNLYGQSFECDTMDCPWTPINTTYSYLMIIDDCMFEVEYKCRYCEYSNSFDYLLANIIPIDFDCPIFQEEYLINKVQDMLVLSNACGFSPTSPDTCITKYIVKKSCWYYDSLGYHPCIYQDSCCKHRYIVCIDSSNNRFIRSKTAVYGTDTECDSSSTCVNVCSDFMLKQSIYEDKEFNEYLNENFQIYPNPAENKFTLEYIAKDRHYSMVFLISSIGDEEKIWDGYISKGSGSIDIDIRDFQPGSYLIKTYIDGIPRVKKLIISE